MVEMWAVGGGGGGAGGAVGTTVNGGAGGGSSGAARFLCPALLLPDILYIYVGKGGFGGASASVGAAGAISFAITGKTEASPNYIIMSGAADAGGGGGTTGGTRSTAAIQQTINNCGIYTTSIGQTAPNSSTGNGADVALWGAALPPFSAGAPGGGVLSSVAKNGGSQTLGGTTILDLGSSGQFPASAGGAGKGGTAGGVINGDNGVSLWKPFLQSGGAGGASVIGATGGAGGKGGIGCGGGGGGSSTTAGGRGGDGGDGIIIITSW